MPSFACCRKAKKTENKMCVQNTCVNKERNNKSFCNLKSRLTFPPYVLCKSKYRLADCIRLGIDMD